MARARGLFCLPGHRRHCQGRSQTPPPDGQWTADADLSDSRLTDSGLGAVQGVAVRDGRLYAYGDLVQANPRIGVIREYDLELKATGRVVWLRRDGKPLILHPTGLTWDHRFGTFLGDTVLKKAVIYQLDWKTAWKDGHLDRAVLQADRRRRGRGTAAAQRLSPSRGEPFWRLPTTATRPPRPSLRPGSSALSQTLEPPRDHPPHSIRPVQPEHALGRRERPLDLRAKRDRRPGLAARHCWTSKGVFSGHVGSPGVRVRSHTFTPHDELEGYWPLDQKRSILAVARRRDNLVLGVIETIEPRGSTPVRRDAEPRSTPHELLACHERRPQDSRIVAQGGLFDADLSLGIGEGLGSAPPIGPAR